MKDGLKDFNKIVAVVNIITMVGTVGLMAYFMILYYEKNANQSNCTHNIPLFLLVITIAWFVMCALQLTYHINKHYDIVKTPCGRVTSVLGILVTIFFIVWFIIGNVWTFSENRNPGKNDTIPICDNQIYETSFWFIVGSYIYFAVFFIFIIVLAFCCTSPTLRLRMVNLRLRMSIPKKKT